MNRPLIIAEAGVNHNGDLARAEALVAAAAQAGADVVKFQTFLTEELVTAEAPKAAYQLRQTGSEQSQAQMLKALELPWAAHHALKVQAESLGLEFLSTAFDRPSLRFLVDELGLARLKLPSGELTNLPFVLDHARTGLPLIVSTGMATLAEIETALGVIAFGRIAPPSAAPSLAACAEAFCSAEGQAALRSGVTILHCTSDYPAAPEAVNLRAMDALAAAFGLPVGYSDHTLGTAVAVAAAARGAQVIEKHFTLDRALPGPDHEASLAPEELAQMVRDLHTVADCLGDGIKRPQPSERATAAVARKSVVARRAIARGAVLCAEDLALRRPGTGLPPSALWTLPGTIAQRDYAPGDLLDE
ncbi:N-acetylneuraminate synthase [Halothiobacillus sp. DCM-1]|uniref:N-acetylneuraminate synthase n=1 Tax=Halothiobacillus sp. DCM-1 TaxID=3112558 RepID=UPI00324CC08F